MFFAVAGLILASIIMTTNTTRAATPSTQAYLPIMIGRSLSSTTAYPPPATPSTPAEAVVNLTNVERAKAGCQPLLISSQLAAAAQRHSDDMAKNNFMDHTGSDGSSPWDRINATGYQFRTAAENIAMGYGTPEEVMNGWMGSAGHRTNILNCALREIGVGYATSSDGTAYWTQNFATPR